MKTKSLLSLLLVILIALTGCTTGSKEKLYEGAPGALGEKEGKVKIAVIRNLGADEHTAQYLAGAKETGESFGFQVDTFTTNSDNAKFEDVVNQAISNKYDGIILSHGQDNAQALIEKAVAAQIPVVTFDTTGSLKDVTFTSQEDESLARLSLQALVDAFPGKTPKIIKMWVAGLPPMERREVVYKEFLEKGLIEEVASIGEVGDFSNVSELNANAMGSLLTLHQKGSVDAVWASWDAFAAGAFTALNENNRQEVKIFGIDVSNADLQMMQAENSPWVETAAADAKFIGTVNMRLMAKKLAGETTPDIYEIPATVIKQEDLNAKNEKITVDTLNKVYADWGVSDTFLEPWMENLKK